MDHFLRVQLKEKKARYCSSDFIPEICGDCSQSEKSIDQFEEPSGPLRPQKIRHQLSNGSRKEMKVCVDQ